MTKAEFLDKLCQGLRFQSDPEEIQKTVNFYAEAIDDRIEDGMTEEEAVEAMGSIDEIVAEMRASWRSGGEDSREGGSATSREENKRVLSAAVVRRIDVFDTSGDIDILPSPDGEIHIEHTASDRWHYDISGEETVTVRRIKNDPGEDTVSFDIFGRKFSVTIPNFNRAFSDELRLKLLLPAGSSVAVNVNAASGDVECREVALDGLNVKLADGDVTVENVTAVGKISLNTASGDMELRGLSAPEISVNSASGDLDLGDVKTASLSLRSVSGDVDGQEIAVTEKLNATAVSGDITLALCVPCLSVQLDAVSGDVELQLPGSDSLYTVVTRSNSGDARVSGQALNGPNMVRVKTMSGDIDVNFHS